MTQTRPHTDPPRLWRLFLKAQNPFMIWLLRSPFHVLVSRIYMLITFTGHTSGRVYTTPVQYVQQGEVLSIITRASYTWWKNLRGGVDVHVHVRGSTYPAHAATSTDPQLINTLLQTIYPGLSSAQRTRFVSGKVAITVTVSACRSPSNS